MKTNLGMDRAVSFLNANVGDAPRMSYVTPARAAAFVTFSRQSGCHAHGVAERVAALLQSGSPAGAPPWTVFDKNLVEEVLKDHHLPEQLRQHMTEDQRSELDTIIGEVFDVRPSAWTLAHHTGDTMLRLAARGHCLLIGRGANFVTRKLAGGLHVRLIGSLAARVARVQEEEQVSPAKARQQVREQDRARARYVKKYYEADATDPAHYDLVLNTDTVDTELAAQLIAQAVRMKEAAG